MLEIPVPVKEILDAAVCPGDICLPSCYPVAENFEALQAGFRTHGITGENLTGTASGQWQPHWYVVALNGMDDPFFVDFSEAAKGYPVYYAPHGAGSWDASEVAPSAAAFIAYMRALETRFDDQAATLAWLRGHTDVEHNELWKEVYTNAADRTEEAATPVDMSEWIPGSIVITGLGENKLKLIQLLKETLQITNAAAMALSRQKEIIFRKGYLVHLKASLQQLEKMGAVAEFRADE